ncbi:phospholipase A1-like [Calliopsis andreniformis]|uniref:phospholipase A1-like n=1 Tax=Calliopsis andreniformis TaxID=337506 RepID=UPI003FCD4BD4
MNIKKNYATIIVAILFLIFFSYSQATDILAGTIVQNVIPQCIFGVKSISFVAYTRNQPNGQVVNIDDKDIFFCKDGPTKPLGILIHGFVTEVNNSDFLNLVNTWLHKEDRIILNVNWDQAACAGGLSIVNTFAYESAVLNVPSVGELVAKFVTRLVNQCDVKVNETVVMGHSLGAHVSGFAGKAIQQLTQQKFKMIVGLDPAGPSFWTKGCDHRLCITDANFVQVYHTSADYGRLQPIGDVDLYFHGGIVQPKCITQIACSHNRAVTYAANSINDPNCYVGVPWQLNSTKIDNFRNCEPSTCAYAGLNAVNEAVRGTFYVNVNSQEPYCS